MMILLNVCSVGTNHCEHFPWKQERTYRRFYRGQLRVLRGILRYKHFSTIILRMLLPSPYIRSLMPSRKAIGPTTELFMAISLSNTLTSADGLRVWLIVMISVRDLPIRLIGGRNTWVPLSHGRHTSMWLARHPLMCRHDRWRYMLKLITPGTARCQPTGWMLFWTDRVGYLYGYYPWSKWESGWESGGTVQFFDALVGGRDTWHWTFEGGVPAGNLEQTQEVTYLDEALIK